MLASGDFTAEQKKEYEPYATALNIAKNEITNQWILEDIEKVEHTKLIRKLLLDLVITEYESQKSSKISTVTNVVLGKGDVNHLISKAMLVPFSYGPTYLAQFIHSSALLKACIDYDKNSLSNEKKERINQMMSQIDTILSSAEFMKGFFLENPDILKSIDIFKKEKNKQYTIKTKKPKYIVWGFAFSLLTGTCVGLYFYLGKKNQ